MVIPTLCSKQTVCGLTLMQYVRCIVSVMYMFIRLLWSLLLSACWKRMKCLLCKTIFSSLLSFLSNSGLQITGWKAFLGLFYIEENCNLTLHTTSLISGLCTGNVFRKEQVDWEYLQEKGLFIKRFNMVIQQIICSSIAVIKKRLSKCTCKWSCMKTHLCFSCEYVCMSLKGTNECAWARML